MHSIILTRHRHLPAATKQPWWRTTPSAVLEHYGWSGLALRLFPTTDTDIAPKDSMQSTCAYTPKGPKWVKPKSPKYNSNASYDTHTKRFARTTALQESQTYTRNGSPGTTTPA